MEVAAEVPVIQFTPDRLPLFQRQYDNNISTGLYAFYDQTIKRMMCGHEICLVQKSGSISENVSQFSLDILHY